MAQYKRPRRSQDGFSLATVILIALAVILGSVAMIDRATSGWLGSLFVGQSREARDAAEIGLAQVVSQLNRSRNRRLLVNAALLNNNTTTLQIEADKSLISPCTTDTPDLSGTAENDPKGEFGKDSIINTRRDINTDSTPLASNGTTRSYRIVSFSQPNTSNERDPGFKIHVGDETTAAEAGEITIVVEGIVRRDETIIATTTISETLEVVPKCCRKSFNGLNSKFGNDTRECDWPPAGVTVGTAQDPNASNQGGLIAKGYAANFTALNSGTPLPYILCASTTTCDNELNANNPTLIKDNQNVVFKSIDLLTSNKTCDNTVNSTLPDQCNITLDPKTLPDNKLTLDASKDPRNEWPEPFKTVCQYATQVGEETDTGEGSNGKTAAIHCSINRLDFGGSGVSLEIINTTTTNNNTVTTVTPVRFHFPNAQTGSIKTIDQRTNGAFIHTSSGGSVTNFSLLGCTSCGTQYVDIGSGSDQTQTLDLFAYFKQGVVNLSGNAGFEGVLWANTIIANGNVSFDVPSGAVNEVLALLDMDSPAIDWVARSIKSAQMFAQ
jgi:hypothetical protein